MNRSKIEWTDYTWNPVTGCLNSCEYCYARRLTKRFPEHFPNGFNPMFYPDRLGEPAARKKPVKIFTVSMGDLFGPWVSPIWQDEIWDAAVKASQHTFQFLTKFPISLRSWIARNGAGQLPGNFWAGVTVTHPLEVWKESYIVGWRQGGVRYVSFEPLLGDCTKGPYTLDLTGIDWIIIGAQTQPLRKPPDEWVQRLIDRADFLKIPVFLKDSIQDYWPEKRREYPARTGAISI